MISDRGWTGSSWALASQGLLAGNRGQEPSGRRVATPEHTGERGAGGQGGRGAGGQEPSGWRVATPAQQKSKRGGSTLRSVGGHGSWLLAHQEGWQQPVPTPQLQAGDDQHVPLHSPPNNTVQ